LEIRPPTSLCNSRTTARVTTPSKAILGHLNQERMRCNYGNKSRTAASHSVA
jgi:hypothetical protein